MEQHRTQTKHPKRLLYTDFSRLARGFSRDAGSCHVPRKFGTILFPNFRKQYFWETKPSPSVIFFVYSACSHLGLTGANGTRTSGTSGIRSVKFRAHQETPRVPFKHINQRVHNLVIVFKLHSLQDLTNVFREDLHVLLR